MFNKKTVVIIGAGASQEAKLPIGTELKERVATLLDINIRERDVHGKMRSGDRLILDALIEHRRRSLQSEDITLFLSAGRTIRDAMPQSISIDNFIDAHNGNEKIELCGKLAIVRAILQAERKSLLYVDPKLGGGHLNYTQLTDTWFTGFMQLLTENCRIDDLSNRLASIRLIVFNYDRCIEHFLYHSLQTYYKIDQHEAAKLVNSIKIYHPYGTVGYLPWQRSVVSVDFGAEPQAHELLALAAQIKTFTEGTDTSTSEISIIHRNVMDANILVFLGFAFHRLNLGLLTPAAATISNGNQEKYDYFATAFGISASDCEIIKTDLIKMKGVEPSNANLRSDLSCNKLLREYWRSLSLSQ